MSFQTSKIISYPGIIFKQEYRIDEYGTIWSPWRGWSEMYQHQNKQGYKELYLYTTSGRKCFKVHRLVLNTFKPIENSENFQVNHIDGVKDNNFINNLEWCTRSENLKHAFANGLEKRKYEQENYFGKINQHTVIEIAELLSQKEKTIEEIAEQYEITPKAVQNIKDKKSWSSLTKNYDFS